ncbi:MAG TPA: PilW family protein [Kofleriaceae bacterium]|nr:PilW family protein [Kofleriaceae bacterium]
MTGAARARGRRQAGMTLVELMIAMVILGIVIAAAFQVAFTMMNGYRDHRRAMAVERSARGAMMFLTDAIRNISPGVQKANITDVVGCSTLKALEVINASDAPDELKMVYASGGVVTSLREAITEDTDALTVLDGSAFKDGDHVLVIDTMVADTPDLAKGHIFKIEGDPVDNGDDWTLPLGESADDRCGGTVPAFTYPEQQIVIRAQLARFYLSGDETVPTLMMDRDGDGPDEGEPVAEGIEDMQIAVGIDLDADGTVEGADLGDDGDDNEWVYDHEDDSQLVAADIMTTPYRALRITLTARSIGEVTQVALSVRPPAEDRPAGDANDIYKRRSLSTTIDIRNFLGAAQ